MASRRRHSLSIAAISAVLAFGGSAHAQSAEAEKLFNDGNRLLAAGKVAEACEAFAASNRAEPRAGTLIQLGDCRERNHQIASAWAAFKDALVRVKDPRKRQYATAKVAALEPRLPYLTITVADDSRVDGLVILREGQPVDSSLWNRALPIDGGDYVITGRAPGYTEWKVTAHVPRESDKLTIKVPKLTRTVEPVARPVVTAAAPPVAPPAVTAVAPAPARPLPPRGTFTRTRKIAVTLAGVALVSTAAGIAFGALANSKKDDAFAKCPDPEVACTSADDANQLIGTSHDYATGANVAFGVAVASGVAAGILWFTGAPQHETAPHVSVKMTPSSVGLVGSFAW